MRRALLWPIFAITSISTGVAVAGAIIGLAAFSAQAGEPSTSLQIEYLMTLNFATDAPQIVDANLRVVNVPSGWVEGPRLKGKIVSPSGDWLKVMPSGVVRLDFRATIQTDDGEIIFISSSGVLQCPKDNADRLAKGELLKTNECYYITAPTFETKSEKYGWLNGMQAIGKMIEVKRGDHVTWDVFALK